MCCRRSNGWRSRNSRLKSTGKLAHGNISVRAKLEKIEQFLDPARKFRIPKQMVTAEYKQISARRKRLNEHILLQRHAEARLDSARIAANVQPEDAN